MLIKRILQKNPDFRPTAAEILQDDWFVSLGMAAPKDTSSKATLQRTYSQTGHNTSRSRRAYSHNRANAAEIRRKYSQERVNHSPVVRVNRYNKTNYSQDKLSKTANLKASKQSERAYYYKNSNSGKQGGVGDASNGRFFTKKTVTKNSELGLQKSSTVDYDGLGLDKMHKTYDDIGFVRSQSKEAVNVYHGTPSRRGPGNGLILRLRSQSKGKNLSYGSSGDLHKALNLVKTVSANDRERTYMKNPPLPNYASQGLINSPSTLQKSKVTKYLNSFDFNSFRGICIAAPKTRQTSVS